MCACVKLYITCIYASVFCVCVWLLCAYIILCITFCSSLQQMKSTVAAKAIKSMNPAINVVAHQNRVGPESEGILWHMYVRVCVCAYMPGVRMLLKVLLSSVALCTLTLVCFAVP